MQKGYWVWGMSELVAELETRDAKLIKWEKKIADALDEGDDDKALKMIESVLGEMRKKITETKVMAEA